MGTGRFVADVHLAKLAKYLRLLGFDTLYFNQIEDDELIRIAKEEDRTILTKDRGLCARCECCYIVKSNALYDQLKEVLERFGLEITAPFSRCMVDNALVEPVAKEEVFAELPIKVRRYFHHFWRCPECKRIYWHGSHWERMRRFIEALGGKTP